MKLIAHINDLLGNNIEKSVQPGLRGTFAGLFNANCPSRGNERYSYGNSNKLEWFVKSQTQPAIQGLVHG
jgi:hypothetical protein